MYNKSLLFKLLSICLTFFSFFIFFSDSAEAAWNCRGRVECCVLYGYKDEPAGCKTSCSPLDPNCVICNREAVCEDSVTSICGSPTSTQCIADYTICGGKILWNSCGWVEEGGDPPEPPVTPPSGDGPGDVCTLDNNPTCDAGCGQGQAQYIYKCERPNNGGWYYKYEDHGCTAKPCCNVGTWSSCTAPMCGACTQRRYNECSPNDTEYQTVSNCPPSCLTNFCSGKPACGQSHGVCGSCGSTDKGSTPPVVTSPANAATVVLNANNEVTFTWSSSVKAEKYEVQIYPNKVGLIVCTDPLSYCNNNVTGNSLTYALPLTDYPTWTFRVRAVNTTCTPAGEFSTWATITFNPTRAFTANLFVDDAGTSALNLGTGKCEQPGVSVPADSTIRANMNVTRPGAPAITTTRTGHVFTANVPYVKGLRANLARLSTMSCQCPDDCSTNIGGDFTYNFYVGQLASALVGDPWWQTQNGLVYAGANASNAIISKIPDSCEVKNNLAVTEQNGMYEADFPPSNLIDGDYVTAWKELRGGAPYNDYRGRSYLIFDFGQPVRLDGFQFLIPGNPPTAVNWFQMYAWNTNATGAVVAPGQVNMGVGTPTQTPSGSDTLYSVSLANQTRTQQYRFFRLDFNQGTITPAQILEATPVYAAACGAPFSLQDASATVNSSGVAITGGGDIDVSASVESKYGNLRQDNTAASLRAIGSEYKGTREDYEYFYNKYSMGTAPTTDFNGNHPAGNPDNGRAFFRSGDTNITTPWNVPANKSHVIFIDGNLTISSRIRVAPGGFLAFIVKGDITFANTLGNSTPTTTTSNVEGVFIGDRIIVQGGRVGGDLKFVGEGTFVGWNGVDLQRAYIDPATNGSASTELFRYRPDLLFNTPERMKQPNILWQETN